MTPDEIRRLAPDKVILIPERQNPILADRIVYYEDIRFKALVDAQKGPLPYPDPLREELDTLRAEMAALRNARVVYSPTRSLHPATEPAASTVHLAQIVEAEPDVPAGSVIIGDDIVMAAQAGMDAFDHELQETKAAATAEIDLS